MKNYDEFISGLQEEIKVPEKVWGQFQHTLRELPAASRIKKGHAKRWAAAAASAAVILALGTGFCYAKPMEAAKIAAKIPIIGKLFEQVETDVTFSGNYSEKSQVLTENKKELQDSLYVAEDQGTKITASEIYCDGYSVYLTAKLEFEDGKLLNTPSYSVDLDGNDGYEVIYTSGSWYLSGETDSRKLVNNVFEGKVIDNNTFIGMMKLDIREMEEQKGVLELQMTQLGYDDVTMMDNEDISASYKVDGQWNLSIPFNVDDESTREIFVNQKTDAGYGISKLIVSPYQVVVYSDVPYTTAAEEGLTREAFDQMWEDKTRGIDNPPDLPYTYEEYLQEKRYVYNEVAVFNQDGVPLDPTQSDYTRTIFAVRDLDIEKLHIYLSDKEGNEHSLWRAQNIDEARERSIFEVSVEVD